MTKLQTDLYEHFLAGQALQIIMGGDGRSASMLSSLTALRKLVRACVRACV